MLTTEISISIPGHAAPKGSLRHVGNGVLIEDNKRTKEWRSLIAGWVTKKWPEGQNADRGQPVGVEVTFTLPRPKSHYGTGRNAQRLKASAQPLPVGHRTGDTDKLVRLVLDALQDAELLPDDCAVIEVTARKTYVDGPPLVPDALGYPGVLIRMFPYDPAGAPA